ncbi:T9SS type A sorting domain-containing protein [bacterium]|nr:T9SS type A sorting domain-containing protein [bacterium]
MKKACFVLLSVLFASISSFAAVHEVPTDYDTIQEAINALAPGDTVLVLPGVYTEYLTLSGEGVVLTSMAGIEDDSTYAETTIIEPLDTLFQAQPLLSIASSDEEVTKVIGFTFRHGRRGSETQNGVIEADAGNLDLIWNIFSDNHSGWGAVCNFSHVSGNFHGNRVIGNYAAHSYMVSYSYADVNVAWNHFEGNYAAYSCGALGISSSNTEIHHNRFVRNTSSRRSGALYVIGESPYIHHNDFFFNRSDQGGAFTSWGSGRLVIEGNVFKGNIAGHDTLTSYSGEGSAMDFVVEGGHAFINDNVFYMNDAYERATISGAAQNLHMRRNRFVDNTGGLSASLFIPPVNQIEWVAEVVDNLFLRNRRNNMVTYPYQANMVACQRCTLKVQGNDFYDNDWYVAGGQSYPGASGVIHHLGNYWGHPTGPWMHNHREWALGDTMLPHADTTNFVVEPFWRHDLVQRENEFEFPETFVGDTSHATTWIVNNSSRAFLIDEITSDSLAYSAVLQGPPDIAPGDSVELVLRFHPQQEDLRQGTVHVIPEWDLAPPLRFWCSGTALMQSSPEQVDAESPGEYRLYPAYPNPFNPETMLRFALKEAGEVKLTVYNLQGQVVETVVSGRYESGVHDLRFNASGLAGGMYFYRLEVNGFQAVKKMMLVR